MKIEMPYEGFNALADCAFHYACGRATYIVGIISKILNNNKKYLSADVINDILETISERRSDDRLGMDMDHEDWITLYHELENHKVTEKCPSEEVEVRFRDEVDFALFILSAMRYSLYIVDPKYRPRYNEIIRKYSKFMYDNWRYNFKNEFVEATEYFKLSLDDDFNKAMEYVMEGEKID